MRRRDGLRDQWRAEVLKTPRIADSVRVLLLALADDMTMSGHVSVPRSKLAARLGRSPQRITDRIHQAREAGLLDIVRAGRPGVTAAYAAMIPARDGPRVRTKTMVRIQDHAVVHPSGPWSSPVDGPHGGVAIARASVTATKERTDGASAEPGDRRCRLCGQPSGSFDEHVECLRDEVTRTRAEVAS